MTAVAANMPKLRPINETRRRRQLVRNPLLFALASYRASQKDERIDEDGFRPVFPRIADIEREMDIILNKSNA